MKKIKKICAVVLALVTLCSFNVMAEEKIQNEAVFDLNSSVNIQSTKIIDSQGNEALISLERKENPATFSSDPLLVGTYTYTIKFTSGIINLSYDVDIQYDFDSDLKAKMSNIGNSNYTTIGGKVSKESLKINTAKETAGTPAKATYKVWMEAYGGSAATTMSLIARAQNGKLTVKTS